MRLRAVAVALALLLPGCDTVQPSPRVNADQDRFAFTFSARGTATRLVSVDVRDETQDSHCPVLNETTTTDDDVDAVRRIQLDARFATSDERRRKVALSDHIVLRELRVRPVRLVIEFRGREDIYHLSFPDGGGVQVEPSSGSFSDCR